VESFTRYVHGRAREAKSAGSRERSPSRRRACAAITSLRVTFSLGLGDDRMPVLAPGRELGYPRRSRDDADCRREVVAIAPGCGAQTGGRSVQSHQDEEPARGYPQATVDADASLGQE
jgi:hypothetical protein